MGQSYELKIISVSEVDLRRNFIIRHIPGHDTPKLYIAIDIDGKRVYQTNPSRKWKAMWNQICTLSVDSPSSLITLQILHKSKCVAKKVMEIDQLLGKAEGPKDFSVLLNFVKEKSATDTPRPILVVRMTSIGHVQAGALALANATEDIGTLTSTSTSSAIVDIGVANSDLLSGLKSLLSRLQIIHHYSNMALKVLSSVYEAVKKQKETDKNVGKLVQTMADVFYFAEEIESVVFEKIKRFEKTIYALVKQTEECAWFIREYTGHGFSGRLLNNVRSEYSDKIEDFITVFGKLRESLDRGTTMEILSVVEETAQTQKLNSLKPADMNASLRPVCLPGTRQELRDLITNWLVTPSDVNAVSPGNIFWLSGVAGAGKSTVATSISEYFRELGRLGAFLFFTRNKSDPADVIRTIAFHLAHSNIHVASAICAAIDEDHALIDSPIHTQFQKLLLAPLTKSQNHIHGPIVIVLDALDECGNAESRRTLISLISDEFFKLPAAVRFFITSRPDSDIASKFEIQQKITKHLLDITMPSSFTDIRIYLDNEMREIRQEQGLATIWPGELTMEAITKHSSGLFIWASTATKYLRESFYPNEALKSLLDNSQTTLDDLYTGALKDAGPWKDPMFTREAQAALSVVVLGKAPVSDSMIDALLGLEPEHSSSRIFKKLRCVVQWAPGQDVKILHASFSDYLTDHGRSGDKPWFVDPSILEPQIAQGCLHILEKELRFNICEFEDSHIYTTKVPGPSECITDLSKCITDHITDHIFPQLFYSSLYWASHLAVIGSGTPISSVTRLLPDGLLEDLKDLMYTKFLFWLEVLCVQQKVGVAIDALEAVANLAKNYWHEEELADFATDAVKFVLRFAPVISHSVPHIYLSALPFAPSESKVKKQYSFWLVPSKTVGIQSSVSGQWPRLQATIEGHSDWVWSVAFSPDGNHIASGSADRTLRVWDARTGDLLVGPFNGHNDIVRHVAFSCDGKNIVSGSDDGTMCVWDAQTGKTIGIPLIRHTDKVTSVCFSPNARQIASASLDKTIHIWDWDEHSEGNTMPLVIKHAASVCAVAFAPDRGHVVSGSGSIVSPSSDGNLVQVWDTQTGKLVTGPLKGHTQYIRSVAFSPNGKHILSLSHEAARIWDACTGTEIITIPTPIGTNAYSAAFTPNGKQIVVGYSDTLLRIWDVQTGALVSAPIDGHSGAVLSVSVSPDGMRIASGSNDKTIRVWDAYQELSAALKVDTQYIGANDQGTAQMYHPRVSDAQTGALVEGPFKFQVPDPTYRVIFSPDGQLIGASGKDSVVRFFNLRSSDLRQLEGHTEAVRALGFSQDGKWIVSGSDDTTVRVWDLETRSLAAGPFEGHQHIVYSVDFSPDRRRVVSGSYDSSIRVFETTPDDILKNALRAGSLGKDGWLLNSMAQPILWVPPWLHRGLYFPQNSVVIHKDGTTKLDFTHFVEGTAWKECVDV
ncbi:WD40-repeat-containing domain protein [Rhodocollybia butyracea]|uniref:WD40-repeat-containing domain protein n=1 Tax=Rhodocollybia butyracea TaxID=206335 RepID=A0A9P5PD14_9AGAR|nr:WD40-repeat-containing domain protein [Rhodocollybia butyracea]